MRKKITATRVSQLLDISVQTLNHWYSWYEHYDKPEDTPVLPKYEQAGTYRPRYWDTEDIDKLLKFKAWIKRGRGGVMGNYNAKLWGERGKRALENKRKNALKNDKI